MADPAALVNDLIALIPEDGRRITNEEIRAALEREAGEPIGEEELKELKSQVVAMGFAERVKGPGGGLKAPGVEAPARAAAVAAGARSRRGGQASAAPAPQAAIPPGTTTASVLTGELRHQIDRIWDAFCSGGIANPLEVLEQLTYLQRKEAERERERTAQSFCVPKAEIAEKGYDLSLNRYKELIHEEVEHRSPLEILAELRAIEQEILQGIDELEGMLR